MKKSVKFTAALLAAAFIVLMLPVGIFAAEGFAYSDFEYEYSGPKDTPLLVLLVNFDPSQNGADGEDGEMMLQHMDHSYWSELFFGDGPKGLKSYFETQSGGNFRFTPAPENYENGEKKDEKNDGIVEVSVETAMKKSTSGSTGDPELSYALRAASEQGYVDFAAYDTNKDGKVEQTELVIALISAGYESTRTSKTPSYNAHASDVAINIGGVTVSTGYVKCGEMMGSGPLTVGSFCHELGHVLGNGDLYNRGTSWGGANSPAGKVSIMAGNGSAGANSGEPKGTSPSNYDPYHLTVYGLYDYTTVADGTYTLYSRQSTKSTYNILKVSTPNPTEYYLIENRFNDSSTPHFDSATNFDGTRGIIIWHVDQKISDAGRAGGGMMINSGGKNPDIGVAALHPTNEHPASSGVFN